MDVGEWTPTRSTAERVARPVSSLAVMPRPAGSGAQPLLAAPSAEAVMVGQGKSVRTARSAPEG
jgi:hypothetical protein